jgi:transposase
MGDVAARDGLRFRHDVLETASRVASGGSLGRTASHPTRHVGSSRSIGLVACLCGLGQCRGAACSQASVEKGGYRNGKVQKRSQDGARYIGPNPTDRGKQGTKRHIVVDARGTPLAVVLSGANVHDSKVLGRVLDAIPPVYNGKPGAPRFRPEKLHADKGYDYPCCREDLRERGIQSRIARRGIESCEKLGRYRWVVERTLAWFNKYRRLKVRYERRDDIHLALLLLGSALICWNQIQRFC